MKQQRNKKPNGNKRKLITTANDKGKTNNNGIDTEQHIHHHSQHDNTHDNHEHAHHHQTNNQHGVDNALKHIQDNLRGANIHIGDERKLQGSQSYNYQVDLYIEIDQAFVNLNQGVLEPNTVDYLNAIVTGAVSLLLYNNIILCPCLFASYLFLYHLVCIPFLTEYHL